MKTSPITAGQFYENMTIDEAKKKKIAKSTFSRDFLDVDKNKDGILSRDEIILERKSMAKRYAIGGVLGTALGACTLFENFRSPWALLDAAIGVLGVLDLFTAYSYKKETDKIEANNK